MLRPALIVLALLAAALPCPLSAAPLLEEAEEVTTPAAKADELREEGTEALDERQWDRAIELFTQSAAANPKAADGALYWKAYAQGKRGLKAEAVRTVAELRKAFPQSRWASDAQALEIELRSTSGQPVSPDAEANEELKLVALNSLMGMEPEKALPLLEKLLKGTSAPRVRDRALFVLSQNPSPRARQILADTAKGQGHPDLQKKAIRYLGMSGDDESRRVLEGLWAAADTKTKRQILQAFLMSGDRARVLRAAQSEPDANVRGEAVRVLGAMGAPQELAELYRTETVLAVKKDALQALAVGGSADALTGIARTETNPELRRVAVRNLGLLGAERTGATLAAIYAGETDREVREAALEAMFIQGDTKGLVAIARRETDREMKKRVVARLALMNGREATDYLLEILEK